MENSASFRAPGQDGEAGLGTGAGGGGGGGGGVVYLSCGKASFLGGPPADHVILNGGDGGDSGGGGIGTGGNGGFGGILYVISENPNPDHGFTLGYFYVAPAGVNGTP
jgi:hypothetical protein